MRSLIARAADGNHGLAGEPTDLMAALSWLSWRMGVMLAAADRIDGCVRVTVQAQELKDGKPVESYCIDEPQLEIITKYEAPASAPVLAKTGGPIPTPKRRADVSR